MSAKRLTALYRELRSLASKQSLSSRQRRRRETLLRQIQVAQLQLDRVTRNREERQERQKRVIECRQERRRQRAMTRTNIGERAKAGTKTKRRRCLLCGRPMRHRQRLFCGRRCRKAAHQLPSPTQIMQACERISSQWDKREEFTRSGRLGGGKWRKAAEIIENYAHRQSAAKQSPEAHDMAYHGNGTNRADNEYWNQIVER